MLVMEPAERGVVKLGLAIAMTELEVLDQSISSLEKEIKQRVEAHPVGRKLLKMPGEGLVSVCDGHR